MMKEIRKTQIEEWQQIWDETAKTVGTGYHNMFPKVSIKGTRRNIQDRKLAVRYTRLRTGHSLNRAYLYKIGQIMSPNCPECLEIETVEHLLLQCPKTQEARLPLQKWLKSKKIPLTLEIILGEQKNVGNTSKTSIQKQILKYIQHLPIFPIP